VEPDREADNPGLPVYALIEEVWSPAKFLRTVV
jgi:hypothetical protein